MQYLNGKLDKQGIWQELENEESTFKQEEEISSFMKNKKSLLLM